MKYKCYCAKNFYDLTVGELRSMRRNNEKTIKIEDFVKYYEINAEEYNDRIKTLKGIALTREERNFFRKQREKETAEAEEYIIKEVYTVDSIPDSIVAALFQVDFEMHKGRAFYDVEQLSKARERMNTSVDLYNNLVKETKDSVAYSNLRSIDLKAMRIYRGVNKRSLSKLAGIRESEISFYENGRLKIPKYIEAAYKEVLNIKDRHLHQLRDIMNGKTDKVEEDRTIPKLIKLRVFRRDKGKCTKCSSEGMLHYHHIKRFADGGQNSVENLTLLCVPCHAEEHKGEKSYHMLKSIADK